MYLNVLKVIFILIFTVFIYFNISFYISEKFKNNVELSRKNYDKFIKNKAAQLNRILMKCGEEKTNLFKVTDDLYDKGYNSYDLMEYYKTTTEIKIYYYSIKSYYKSEKLLMVYLLYLIFRTKDNLEIFELI